MIAFLRGTVVSKGDGFALVDVGGVGYRLTMSANSLSALPPQGQRGIVHTHMQVREDEVSLFGFAAVAERQLFEMLLTVPGVGPKLAVAILSGFKPDEFATAVGRDDVAMLSSIPGVGRKTAQRIVVDLRDRIALPDDLAPSKSVTADTAAEAQEALRAMGFSVSEIAVALRGYDGENDAETLIVHALRRLGGPR